MDNYDLGQAIIQPNEPFVAGAFTTIRFTYTCGHPVDSSGYLKITFRQVSDIGRPQFDNPTAPNYCTVSTTGNCVIAPRWDPKGHVRPWSSALFLQIQGGYLNTGEQIMVVFGDTSGGSPGWRMQSNCVESFEFKTFVDPIATYQFKELPVSPSQRVIPGEPVRAVCLAPSQQPLNQPFSYHLKLEDRWGNPTKLPQKLNHPGFGVEGVRRLVVTDEGTGLTAVSNPIHIHATPPPHQPFWADFHGQSGETVGEGTIDHYFTFARDYALLDIAAHQGNDFQITDAFWHKINQIAHDFYQPGRFVTFPGYEWSGNTPLGGDRNVFFAFEGGEMSRSSTELVPGDTIYPNSPTVADLYRHLAKQQNPKPFMFAHVGGRYADISVHDPDLELAVEVHSAWGTFEWMLEEAFKRGYRVGICANSDGHKGRPGASYPGAGKFGSYGGLTCVLAAALDRESILEALYARRFYATTGNRLLVDLQVQIGDSTLMMGECAELKHETPHLRGRISGSAPIERVEVRNGMAVIAQQRPYGAANLGRRIKIIWRGAQERGRDRLVRWNGRLHLQNNAITAATPLNFWNADHPLEQPDDQHLAWQSVTTGGTAGVILTLAKADAGTLHIQTLQGNIEVDIAAIGLEPQIWQFGGLQKELLVYRLPDSQLTADFSFSLPLAELHTGDNPIYIHVVQEDEHRAWTSPVYLRLT